MDHDQAQRAFRDGELMEALISPAEDANGWVLMFRTAAGRLALYTGRTGTEKVYHTLDQATQVAKGLGFESIRIEEEF
jgi:hypothetical protein